MSARPERGGAAVELAGLAVACLAVLGPSRMTQPGFALGRPTRDLYDHLALLDQWSIRVHEWSWPAGGSLVPPDLFGMVLSAPWLWVDRALAYNFAVFAQLFCACVAGWALGRRFGSGWVGGAVFGLSPYVLGQAFGGEAETLSIWPVAAAICLLDLPGRRAWIGAGLVGALAAVGSWYYGAFVGIVLLAWAAWRGRPGDLGRQAWWAPAAFTLAILPAAVGYASVLRAPDQLFRGPAMSDYLSEHPRALAAMSADPANWLGGAAQGGASHVDALGLIVLFLAGLGVVSAMRAADPARRRRTWAMVALLGASLALAVGPIVHWAGASTGLPGPARLLAELPLVGLMRLPHRWTVLATVALAALAAQGAAAVAGRRMHALLAALVVCEAAWFCAPHRPVTDVRAPSVVQAITGPVLDLPARTLGDDARGRYLVWQREHRQPTPYSLLMQGWSPLVADEPLVVALAAMDRRDPIGARVVEAGQFRQAPFARAVAEVQRVGELPTGISGARDRLRGVGLSQVVLHTALLHDDDVEGALSLLVGALGPPDARADGAALWNL